MKKTEVISGVCFGYFDAENFEECKECLCAKECEKATASDKVEEVRNIHISSEKTLEKVVNSWKD